jgi:hypothetical protein
MVFGPDFQQIVNVFENKEVQLQIEDNVSGDLKF